MTGQNDRGRNQGLHDQGHPHRGTVVLQAIEADLDSDIGLAFVLCARTPEGLLSDSEVPDKHGLTAEAWSSDRFVITSISEANDKPLPPINARARGGRRRVGQLAAARRCREQTQKGDL